MLSWLHMGATSTAALGSSAAADKLLLNTPVAETVMADMQVRHRGLANMTQFEAWFDCAAQIETLRRTSQRQPVLWFLATDSLELRQQVGCSLGGQSRQQHVQMNDACTARKLTRGCMCPHLAVGSLMLRCFQGFLEMHAVCTVLCRHGRAALPTTGARSIIRGSQLCDRAVRMIGTHEGHPADSNMHVPLSVMRCLIRCRTSTLA